MDGYIFRSRTLILMGLELVREFDDLAKKLYSVFDDDDLNEWTEFSERERYKKRHLTSDS